MSLDISRLQELAVSDSGFVFDPLTGYTFTVNPTGLFVLQAIKQGASVDELPGRIADTFEFEGGEDVSFDLSEFVASLRATGLVR
jgi:PqqD family protein of HPr-rel-A system